MISLEKLKILTPLQKLPVLFHKRFRAPKFFGSTILSHRKVSSDKAGVFGKNIHDKRQFIKTQGEKINIP